MMCAVHHATWEACKVRRAASHSTASSGCFVIWFLRLNRAVFAPRVFDNRRIDFHTSLEGLPLPTPFAHHYSTNNRSHRVMTHALHYLLILGVVETYVTAHRVIYYPSYKLEQIE